MYVSVLREAFGTCYAGEGYSYPVDAILMAKTEKQIRWSYRDEIVDCPGGALP